VSDPEAQLIQAGYRDGVVLRGVYTALVRAEGLAAVVFANPSCVQLVFAHGSVGLVLPMPTSRALDAARALLDRADGRPVEIVVVGDAHEEAAAVRALCAASGDAAWSWVRSDGSRWVFDHHDQPVLADDLPGPDAPLASAFAHPLPAPGPDDWASLRALTATAASEIADVIQFQAATSGRTPWVTRVLLGLIVAVFGIELLYGADPSVAVLRRLGGLDPQALRDGAWWLVASPTFLHGDLMHLAFNGAALYQLGRRVEPVLGSAWFVLVYGAAGVAGALASALHLPDGGVSVGASGAIWGLFAAEAAWVWGPGSPLPALSRRSARRGLGGALVMNLFVSFLPNVDWAAHFGGGAIGGLVALAAVRLRDDARATTPVRALAAGMVALYLSALAAAMVAAVQA
jgi:membrane associated rhomboid family serine protease